MIRKTVIAVLLATLLAVAGWAQVDIDGDFTIQSVQAYTSFGLFMNALDGAANVDEQGMGPGFSELENKYVFGGLANMNLMEADEYFSSDAESQPLLLGYMNPGDMPWSVFSGTYLDETAVVLNATESDVAGQNTETIVDGTTETDYVWYDELVTTEYTDRYLTDQFRQYLQFITRLGPANVGVALGYAGLNDYTAGSVYTETTTYQYDTAAAGEVPTPTTDYTGTYTQADYSGADGKITSLGLRIPVYVETGDLSHAASLGVGFDRTNLSSTQSLVYTVPQDNTNTAIAGVVNADTGAFSELGPGIPAAAGTQFIDIPEFGDTRIGDEIPIDLGYTLSMPMLGEHEDNRLMVGLDSGLEIASTTYSRTEIWQLNDFAVGGDVTANERSEFEITTDVGSLLSGNARLMGGHSFYYDLGDGVTFGVEPGLWARYGWDVGYDDGDGDVTNGITFAGASGTLTSATVVTRVDGDTDGAFTSAADTITTEAAAYNNTVWTADGLQSRVDQKSFTTSLTLPASVKIQPEGWSFAFTLGTNPGVSVQNITNTGVESTSATTTTAVDGAGDPVDLGGGVETQIGDPGQGAEYTYSSWQWSAYAQHRIAVNMMLPADVSVDVALDLSSGMNILDFRNLVVQAIIPLP
jgi:hypothetical protein